MTKLLLAAALLAGAATAATAEPEPPDVRSCHVYWQPAPWKPVPGLPSLPGEPVVHCER